MHPTGLSLSLEKMKQQLRKVVMKTSHKREKVFAFIDAQNIAKGIENSGWKIDWSAFRRWLATNYNVSQAHMYIGYMAENRDLYIQLNNNGFNIDLKQTVKSTRENSSGETSDVKGNVDVDLTIGAWREYNNYNKAIIVSGDGDFTSLIEHLIEKRKLKKIIVPEFYSSLFKKFDDYVIELNSFRKEFTYVRNRHARRPPMKNASNMTQPVPVKQYKKTPGKPLNKDFAKANERRRAKQAIKQRMHVFNKK